MPLIETYTGSLDDDLLSIELEPNEGGIGLNYPFGIDGRPFSSTYTTLAAAKANIKILLQTEVGERVMQPQIGISLRDLLFDNFDKETVIVFKDRIITAIET